MAAASQRKVLVLDAMGVIYQEPNNVIQLLIPLIAQSGGLLDGRRIHTLYRQASVGRLSSSEFWTAVGLDSAYEDRYLESLELTPGLLTMLADAQHRFSAIACLSNDVNAWSKKAKERFALDQYISTWVISGDVGHRKPGPEIYRILLDRLPVEPHRTVFADDKSENLDAARTLGMQTVRYSPVMRSEDSTHAEIQLLAEVLDFAGSP